MTSTHPFLQYLTKRSLLLLRSEIAVDALPVVFPIARGPGPASGCSVARHSWHILATRRSHRVVKNRSRIIFDHTWFAAPGFISRAMDAEIWSRNRFGEKERLGVMPYIRPRLVLCILCFSCVSPVSPRSSRLYSYHSPKRHLVCDVRASPRP